MQLAFLRPLRAALLASLVASAASAQSRGVLEGRVVDAATGAPIPAARVMLASRTFPVDSLGRVRVEGLAGGAHRFRAEALGYNAAEARLEVGEGASVTHVFALTPDPVRLPGVVGSAAAVSPEIREIAARRERHRSSGRFLAREDLDRRESSTLANVLRSTMPGMQFTRGRGSELYAASSRSLRPGSLRANTGTAPCFMQIFLDGTKIFGPEERSVQTPPDLETFFVKNLEAIEFYASPSSTPVEFRNGTAGCGTLVIWTRRG